MSKYDTVVSEREFEQQTANIDKRAIRRRKIIQKTAVFIICMGVILAAVIWGISFAVSKVPAYLAGKTFDMIREAKITGFTEAKGNIFNDIITDITYFSLDETENVVTVLIFQLDESKIKAFKQAFPKAKRVVFEEGYLIPSSVQLTAEEKTAPNIRAKVDRIEENSIVFTVENTSQYYSYYLRSVRWSYLERYIDGTEGVTDGWYEIPEIPKPRGSSPYTASSLKVIIPIGPGNKESKEVYPYGNNNLPDGKYRIVIPMEVTFKWIKFEDYEPTYTVAIEFEIE